MADGIRTYEYDAEDVNGKRGAVTYHVSADVNVTEEMDAADNATRTVWRYPDGSTWDSAVLPAKPIFAEGDQVTYVQSVTRQAIKHATAISSHITSDGEPGDKPYRVYRVELRDGGEGYPWSESCLVRGWLEPLTQWP